MVPLVALLLATSPVAVTAPQSDTPATTTATTPPKAVKEKKVCRRESVMGSIMPKRTCHTAEEWAAIDRANAEATRDALDRRRPNAAN